MIPRRGEPSHSLPPLFGLKSLVPTLFEHLRWADAVPVLCFDGNRTLEVTVLYRAQLFPATPLGPATMDCDRRRVARPRSTSSLMAPSALSTPRAFECWMSSRNGRAAVATPQNPADVL